MDWKIAISVVIFTPAVAALAAFAWYTTRYMRLRISRKITWVDHLHDSLGGLSRLIMPVERPEEHRCFSRMMISGALFAAYVLIVMTVFDAWNHG